MVFGRIKSCSPAKSGCFFLMKLDSLLVFWICRHTFSRGFVSSEMRASGICCWRSSCTSADSFMVQVERAGLLLWRVPKPRNRLFW